LDWRHRHNGISGERTTVWTYDDLFSFVNDRLAVAEQDAADLLITGCEFQAPQKCLKLTSVYAINFMP
jgi:hypothetical protein